MFESNDTGEPLILGIIVIICTALVILVMVMATNKINDTIKVEHEKFIKQLNTTLNP